MCDSENGGSERGAVVGEISHRIRQQNALGTSGRTEFMATVAKFHDTQRSLCDQLEEIADGLPAQIDSQKALIVARQILPIIYSAHRFEEERLFGLIPMGAINQESLERLKFEHWEDEASGEDLAEALSEYAKMPDTSKADRLAYMLRGFFDNLRRHIAFEEAAVIPIVRRALADPVD